MDSVGRVRLSSLCRLEREGVKAEKYISHPKTGNRYTVSWVKYERELKSSLVVLSKLSTIETVEVGFKKSTRRNYEHL
jgi:hypothetical protein